MKGSVIAADGSGVKYSELKGNQLFTQYKQQAAALRFVKLEMLTEIEKKSFFISILFLCLCNYYKINLK